MMVTCEECGEPYPAERFALGFFVCLPCGERRAKQARKQWTIVPAGSKQGYTRITRKADLMGIYKGSTVR